MVSMAPQNYVPPAFDNSENPEHSTDSREVPNFGDSPTSDKMKKHRLDSFVTPDTENTEKRPKAESFTTGDFVEEATLLTNVEDYSNQVRQDADNYAQRTKEEIDLLKSEVELELANAVEARKKGEEEAAEIIEQARAKESEIFNQAQEAGQRDGFQQGMDESLAKSNQLVDELHQVMEEIKGFREILMQRHEEEFVELSLIIARKIVARELKTNRQMVLASLKKAMARFEGLGSIKIRVNPSEYNYIIKNKEEFSSYLDENQKLSFRGDDEVAAGAPVIESDFAGVDLDIQKQFDAVDEEIKKALQERTKLYQQTK